MIFKKIAPTFFTLVLGIGVATAAYMDPNMRMEKIKQLFTQYGADTFKILNGFGIGGTGTSEGGKGLQLTNQGEIANIVKSDDGNAFIFCVSRDPAAGSEDIWEVYPIDPMKVGTSAKNSTDANGRPFVATMIAAIRNSPDGKAHHVRYDVLTPDGRFQAREATVWSSRNLLSRKNDTGKKFFCGTSVRAQP